MSTQSATVSSSIPQHSRLLWFLTGGAFLSFFVFGFVDNLKGPALPGILRDLDLNYAQGGTALLGSYFGFLIATLLSGPLADAVGHKSVMVIAGVCTSLGLVTIYLAGSFWLFFAALFVLGLGMGCIEIGGNSMIVALHGAQQGRYLNLLGVCHGIGAMSVPFFVSWMLSRGFLWRQTFLYSLILVLFFLLYFVFARFPATEATKEGGFDIAQLRQSGFTKQMCLFYVALAMYVSAEIGTASWMVEYLQQAKTFSIERSSFYLSLFFGFIIIGRLLGSFVVERVGYLPIMIGAAGASIVSLGIGLFGSAALAIFIPLTGLFYSIVFPTIAAAVSEIHKENVATIFGLLFAFGGIGGMFGPWAIGAVSNRFDIQIGFGLPIIYCIVVMAALAILYVQEKRRDLTP